MHLRPALHDVRSMLTPANRARIRLALSDHWTGEAVVSTRVGMVNELADGAVTNWIEYYLRFAPRPQGAREYENKMPRGAGGRLSQIMSPSPRSLHHVTDKSPIVPFLTIGAASGSFSLQVDARVVSSPAK